MGKKMVWTKTHKITVITLYYVSITGYYAKYKIHIYNNRQIIEINLEVYTYATWYK